MTTTHTLITSKVGTGPYTVEDFINDGVSLTYKVMLPPSVVAGDIVKMETSLFKVKWVVLNPDESYVTKSYNAYTATEVTQYDVERGYTFCRLDLYMLDALRNAGDYRTIVAESPGGFFETKIKVVRSKALSIEGRALAMAAEVNTSGSVVGGFQGYPQTPFGYLAYDHVALFSEHDNRSLVFNEYLQDNRLFSFEGRFRIHPILQEQIVVPEQSITTTSTFSSQSVVNTPEYFYLMSKASYLVRAYHGSVYVGAPTWNVEGSWLRETIDFKGDLNIPLLKDYALAGVLADNSGTGTAILGLSFSSVVQFQIEIVKEKAGQTTTKNVVCYLSGDESGSLSGSVVLASTTLQGTSTSYEALNPFLGDPDATYSFNILNTPTLNGVGVDLHFTFDSVLTNVQKRLFGFSDVANTVASAADAQYGLTQTQVIDFNPSLSIYDGDTPVYYELSNGYDIVSVGDLSQCATPRIRVDFTPSAYLTNTRFDLGINPYLTWPTLADIPGSTAVRVSHVITASEATAGVCYVQLQDPVLGQLSHRWRLNVYLLDHLVRFGLSLVDYHTTDSNGREFITAIKTFYHINSCQSFAGAQLSVDIDAQEGSGTLSVASNDTFMVDPGDGNNDAPPGMAIWTTLSDASAQFWSPTCASSPDAIDTLATASFAQATQRGLLLSDSAHYGTSLYDDAAWDSQTGFRTGVYPQSASTVIPVNTTSFLVNQSTLEVIK
jgi:hypothetical protein